MRSRKRAPSTRGASGLRVVNEPFIGAGRKKKSSMQVDKTSDSLAGDKPVCNTLSLSPVVVVVVVVVVGFNSVIVAAD